jgi:AraC family transcriptional regulator of adaptative response / DNA-3-methyladenine glycosylase II
MSRMKLARPQMLRGMYGRDRALDGRYLVAVQTTRIYCLPSCPARKPKPEHVLFFLTPDAARVAGFRACKRCRPDLFHRGADPDMDACVELVRRVRADPQRYASTHALAAASGFGASKLTALMREHYHTTPGRLLLQARVARACELLAKDEVATGETGFAAGFESAAAYYPNFRRATGLSPGDYRALPGSDEMILALPQGYRAESVLRIQGRDAQSPCERVEGTRIVKAFDAQGTRAVLHMHLEGTRVYCRVERGGAASASGPVMYAAHTLAVRLLGLAADPSTLVRRARDERERALFARRPGLRVSLMGDAFEALCWAIIGQQVNLRFASSLRRRLIELCGKPVPGGMRAHPGPEEVAGLEPAELRPMQYSARKAEHLIGAARAIAANELPLVQLGDLPAARARHALLQVPGIGPWTSEYVLMRGIGLADCLPVGDAGLVAALKRFYTLDERPDAERTRELMAPFSPQRSLATEHFWTFLGDTEDV